MRTFNKMNTTDVKKARKESKELVKSVGCDWHEIDVEWGGKYYARPATQMELMQFTGLRDKTGKALYEGDIVVNTEYECEGMIVFDDDMKMFCFAVRNIDGSTDHELLYDYADDLLVIGNIYEDPNLGGWGK